MSVNLDTIAVKSNSKFSTVQIDSISNSNYNDYVTKTQLEPYRMLEIDQSSAIPYDLPLQDADNNSMELKITSAGAGATNLYLNKMFGETNSQCAKRIQTWLGLTTSMDTRTLFITMYEPCGSGGINITSDAGPNVSASTKLFTNAQFGRAIVNFSGTNFTEQSEAVSLSIYIYDKSTT